MRESLRQLDLEMRQFRHHITLLVNDEDKIHTLASRMHGIQCMKPHLDAGKCSAYEHQNNYISMMQHGEELENDRDYHLYAVHRVGNMLQALDNDDVEFLEHYYWYRQSKDAIAGMYESSVSWVFNERNRILEKMLCAKIAQN